MRLPDFLTGDVTSCTKCLSAYCQRKHDQARKGEKRTNVEQNCAIVLLVDDVVLENLVVQGPGGFHCRRHVVSGWLCGTITVNAREKGNKKRKSEKTREDGSKSGSESGLSKIEELWHSNT